MKFKIISDIHNEFQQMEIPTPGEVLIIAGDLGIASNPITFNNWIREVSERFEYIIYVMGNHEHYHGDINDSYNLIIDEIKDLDNVYLLENNSIQINDVMIYGCTLWSDIHSDAEMYIQNRMNDYQIISNGDKRLRVNDTREIHKNSVKWLTKQLSLWEGKKVVVTHHNPTTKVAEQYRGNLLNPAFGTNLEELIHTYNPDLWVFGHTHVSLDFKVGETRLVCNPRGYSPFDLNPEFTTEMEVDV